MKKAIFVTMETVVLPKSVPDPIDWFPAFDSEFDDAFCNDRLSLRALCLLAAEPASQGQRNVFFIPVLPV